MVEETVSFDVLSFVAGVVAVFTVLWLLNFRIWKSLRLSVAFVLAVFFCTDLYRYESKSFSLRFCRVAHSPNIIANEWVQNLALLLLVVGLQLVNWIWMACTLDKKQRITNSKPEPMVWVLFTLDVLFWVAALVVGIFGGQITHSL